MESRGELCRVGALLPPFLGLWGSNSGHEGYPQVLYPLSHLFALWLVFWVLLFETGFYCIPEAGLEFHRWLGWLF